jgi:hypothetical protein
MSQLHICNTFFERELETQQWKPLLAWLRSHPIILQLQFLPLLYAGPNDHILVSDLPDNPDPRLCLTPPPHITHINHWGPSPAIATFAKAHNIPYDILAPNLLCDINSKIFSFLHSPRLPHAALLQTPAEIAAWIEATPDPKVLKTPFGTAANGHFHIAKCKTQNAELKGTETVFGDTGSNVKRLYIPPLIGEPWVHRLQDFSTQWYNGTLLDVTVFENESNGTYKGTFAGTVEPWALDEHLAVAKPLVDKICQLGYTGHLGIDSFIYLWEGEKRIHPIVEINARKTMSWVALQMPKKQLYYTQSTTGLLPGQLTVRGKTIHFSRNIQ